MIELIVVVILLSVLVGLITPRMLGWTRRQTEATALKFADLLSAAARRDVLSSQRVAIDFDAKRASARVQVLAISGAQSAWQGDPLVPDVLFNEVALTSITSDGVTLDPSSWRIEFSAGASRPAIGAVLVGDSGKETYRVDLPARGTRAIVTQGETPPQGIEPEDLDAEGKAESSW